MGRHRGPSLFRSIRVPEERRHGDGLRIVPRFTPALIDLGEGRIEVAASGLMQLLLQQEVGKVRVLAVMNKTRSPAAPEIPTAAEAGFPQLTFDGVTGFIGWRDIPRELRDRIAADVRAVADDATVRAFGKDGNRSACQHAR